MSRFVFSEKVKKKTNLSSAAVVIGVLRVRGLTCWMNGKQYI